MSPEELLKKIHPVTTGTDNPLLKKTFTADVMIRFAEICIEHQNKALLINFLNWQVRNHRYHSLNNVDETVNIYLKKQRND